ncbi:MAG: HD domain-containing phosphohydrolase [Dehalococcoidia bacterium]
MTSDLDTARPLRLAELLAPLSLATDLGMGAPDEHSARACLLAAALGRRMGLAEPDVADVYYTTLLKHLGCTGTAHEEASHLGGDELATRPLMSRADHGRPGEMLSLLASIGGGRPLLTRGRIVLGMLTAQRWGSDAERAVCEVATLLAARLGMTPVVQQSLGQAFERWDGNGPLRVQGPAILLPARIAHVASRAVAFADLGGGEAAVESVRRSRGGWFDPEVADAFIEHGAALLAEIDAADPLTAALEHEPRPWRTVRPHDVEGIARAFADMADLKSPSTIGHSPDVARLASEAAPRFGLSEAETADLNVAALLHDLGRVGVPSGTWEKRSPLGAADRERIRLHPYYTERILARSGPLAGVASTAALHHERLDGSGYHRGSHARAITPPARLLAAADFYQAKTQARPHRAPLPPEAAAEALLDEARQGRLDPDAAAAVVEAAGGRAPRVARAFPAGLTEREVEVLRLVAEGCSNRDVAERLVISPRTAEHHVQHIYEKIGVSTRAGATMFAMQHDLLASPFDG